MTFEDAFDRLLGHEGGYSNHPADKGGETMWGVTVKVAREAGYVGEMRDMPQKVAQAIYKARYWSKCRCDELPAEIRFDVFDCAVNSGVSTSIQLLQKALGVKEDGIIGEQTISAAKFQAPTRIVARFNGARLNLMTNLNNWDAFGKGWARRIASNLMGI